MAENIGKAAQNLRKLRERASRTQKDIADALGLKVGSYQGMEYKSKRDFLRADQVQAIESALLGRGTPAIDRAEIWEQLAGTPPPAETVNPVTRVSSVRNIVQQLEEIDLLSVRAIRESLIDAGLASPELHSFDAEARFLRRMLRERVSPADAGHTPPPDTSMAAPGQEAA